MTYSVDWLKIAQQYEPGTVPDVGDGAFLKVDADGQLERVTALSVRSLGSYSTGMMVRSFNGLVEVDGNPSRFGRPDNVFGRDWFDALALVNEIVGHFGLPGFSSSPFRPAVRKGSKTESRLTLSVPDGAVLRRVDLCRNFSTRQPGEPSEVNSLIRALGQGTWHGKPGRMMDWSASWGARRGQYATVYAKGPELREHMPKGNSLNDWDPEDIQYRERLAEWCDQVGLIRWEVKFGRDSLRRKGLRLLSEFDVSDLEREAEAMRNKVWPSVGLGGLSDIRERLQSQGVSRRQAAMLQALAFEWASGEDVFGQFEPATAYRYRSLLRGVGVDIRHGLRDVTALRVQPRVIQLQEAQVPDWYRLAA